jgi:hypothetical protein
MCLEGMPTAGGRACYAACMSKGCQENLVKLGLRSCPNLASTTVVIELLAWYHDSEPIAGRRHHATDERHAPCAG